MIKTNLSPDESYSQFLRSKVVTLQPTGFDPDELSEHLFDFQRDIVRWALRKGRAAIFAGTGLGKSNMELEWAKRVMEHTGGAVLLLAPLAVARQMIGEAERFGYSAAFAETQADVKPGVITVTNYDKLHHFDPKAFVGVVLDESSLLKASDGKTRMTITESFAKTQFRLACTATPAPNDHMELGTHAEFIGVMTVGEMLAMYFVHDGGETSKWRLKRHAVGAFWEWMASWATMIQHPRDLGYPTEGYDLPPLNVCQVEVPQEPVEGTDYTGLIGSRTARKESLEARCEAVATLVNQDCHEQWLVWCDLNSESALLKKLIPEAVEVKGSDKPAFKEKAALDFAAGKIRVLVSKSSILGWGLNFQSCARVAFTGLSHSFESYYQAVRRCYRFGQERPVDVYVVTGALEGAVVENINRKERDFRTMQENMIAKTQELTKANIREVPSFRSQYARDIKTGKGWTLELGDCCEVLKSVPDESVHFSVFSPPFSSLYVYSDSERDMGNCVSDEQFYEHMSYLATELLRVLKPGRNLSFHCMNLPTTKARDGFIGIRDFRGDLIRIFQKAGFIYHSEVTIWKNPVTAMQRTKAIGLLHKQLKKDSCISRQGIPDYLVTMRKPGVNPEPCSKTNESFPVSEWQEYASPVWMDIKESQTLQRKSARAAEDERHICPLQLPVIERALRLWTNEGDLVLSPFAGIGSEGYVSLQMGRRFLGIELKPSYFEQAALNLEAIQRETDQLLFKE